jgi:HEAT repeat protein
VGTALGVLTILSAAKEGLAHSGTADDPQEKILELQSALTHAASPDPGECVRGLKALPKCVPALRDEQVAKVIMNGFRRPEAEVRNAACRVGSELVKLAPAYKSSCRFAEVIGDPDKGVRATALECLHDCGGPTIPEEIRALVLALKDPDPSIRHLAHVNLQRAGESTRLRQGTNLVASVAPAVIETLSKESADEEPGVARLPLLAMAVTTLGKVGQRSPSTVPALLKLYARFPADTKRDIGIRDAVVAALAEIGPYSEKSLPFLTSLMRDEKLSLRERVWAARAIGKFGPVAADHVPEMIGLLRIVAKEKTPSPDTISNLMEAFGWLGETAEPAVPLLLELAQGSGDAVVTEYAIRILGELAVVSRKQAAPILAKLLFAKEKHKREDELVKALGRYEEVGVPYVIDALKSGDGYQQEKAIKVIQWLGPYAKPAIPELKRIAADNEHKLQLQAEIVLRKIDR